MSDQKRNEGMKEELENTHADDLEETEEVIVFTKEEFEALMAEEGIDEEEEDAEEIPVFTFTNSDPYAKMEPRPDDAPKRDVSFDEKGNIVVKNPSAYWLPEIKIVDEVGGTEYTVTGSYEGTETLNKKLKRIMEHNAANDNSDITEDSE